MVLVFTSQQQSGDQDDGGPPAKANIVLPISAPVKLVLTSLRSRPHLRTKEKNSDASRVHLWLKTKFKPMS